MDTTHLVNRFNSPSPLVVLDSLLPTRFLLGAKDGSSHRYVLNLEPAVRTVSLLEGESRLLQYLSEFAADQASYDFKSHFVLPLMLREKTSQLPCLADLPTGRNWTLRHFVDGVNFDWRRSGWDVQHCFTAGTALAALHNLSYLEGFLSDFPPDALPHEVDYLKICETGLEKALMRSQDGLGDLRSSLDRCRELLAKSLPYTNVGKPILIHGDWHPGNVMFSKPSSVSYMPPIRALGAIDWDYARRGDRVFDLAYALYMFAGTFRGGKDCGGELFFKDFAEHFIKGYRQIQCKLIADENSKLTAEALEQRLTIVLTLILLFELEQRKSDAETNVTEANIEGLLTLLLSSGEKDKPIKHGAVFMKAILDGIL